MTLSAFEMHMARTGGVEVLQGRSVALSPPAPGEARVAIEAAGVAFADIVMRTGLYPGVKAPVTPGYDLIGRIEALGAGVEGFSVGAARGRPDGHRLLCRPAQCRSPIPGRRARGCRRRGSGGRGAQWRHRLADVSPRRLGPGGRMGSGAWGGRRGRRTAAGSGAAGGVRAIGTASAGKRAVVEAKGGIYVDYRAEPVAERARAISGGGVVAAFDHVGGAHLKTASIAALRDGGTAALYGGYDATRGGKMRPAAMIRMLLADRLSALKLFGASQGVVGYNVTSWRDARPEVYRQDLAEVMALIGAGRLNPQIGATFALAQAAKAQDQLQSAGVAGKIVLQP